MRSTALVVPVLLATACRSIAPAIPLPADDPRPAALVSAWETLVADRRGLRGNARMAVNGAASFRVREAFAVERPDRLRIEVRGFMEQTVAVLVTDGDRYGLFRADRRAFEAGPVTQDLLWREARIALTPEEAIDLLLGGAAAREDLAPGGAFALGDGRIRVDLRDAAGAVRRRLDFDPEARLRRLEALDAGGEFAWEASFDGYREVGGEPFAFEIELRVAAGDTRAEISLRDIELNPELPPDIFRLRLPGSAGSTREEGG